MHLEDPLYKNRDRQAGSLLRTGDKTLVNGDGLMSGGLGSIGTNDGFGIGDGFMGECRFVSSVLFSLLLLSCVKCMLVLHVHPVDRCVVVYSGV